MAADGTLCNRHKSAAIPPTWSTLPPPFTNVGCRYSVKELVRAFGRLIFLNDLLVGQGQGISEMRPEGRSEQKRPEKSEPKQKRPGWVGSAFDYDGKTLPPPSPGLRLWPMSPDARQQRSRVWISYPDLLPGVLAWHTQQVILMAVPVVTSESWS